MKHRIDLFNALSAVALLAALPAQAQQSDASTAQVGDPETLVVIGTRGEPRTIMESSTPIDVLSADQLDKLGGALPLRDALSQLIPSFQAPAMGSSSWDSIARPAGIRGLGGAHVLVLVDGKRRHNSSLINLGTGNIANGSNPVDLDLIPVAAIERIEVLRDGASAQYGSDAIAGVLNIKLKDSADAGQLLINAGQRYEWEGYTEGQTYTLDLWKGFSFGDAGFLTLSLAAKDQQPTVRGSVATANFYFPVNGAPDPREATVDKSRVYQGGLPRVKGVTGALNAGYRFGDLEWYANGTLGSREAKVGQAFRFPNSNQNVLSIYPDGFTPFYTLEEIDWQFATGLRGGLGAWSWDLSTTYGRNDADHGSDNTLNASLGPDSPTTFATFSSTFDLWANNFDVSRDFDVHLASPLTLALGVEHRYERYQTALLDPLSSANGGYIYPADYGGLVGQPARVGAQGAVTISQDDAADLSRNNYAAYVDTTVNVTDAWLVSLAGRAEHYDDSAGNVTSGKFSTRYEFTDGFAVRGTVSNGFRAPSLPQRGFAQTSTQVSIVNGVAQPIDSKTVGVDSPVGRALGARPLKPETSMNYSIGLAMSPLPDLSITLDAYRIELRDRIMLTSYLSGAGVNAILAENGFEPRYVRYFTNAIDTDTEGVELVGTYRLGLGSLGSLRLSAAYNYNEVEIVGIAPNPPELSGLNLTLFDRQQQGAVADNAPLSKLILSSDWRLGDLRMNLRGTRYGSFQNIQTSAAADQHYGADWIVDLDIGYQLSSSVTLAVGANNLLDNYPDYNTTVNTLGLSPYATNSPFGFYGGYYYGRLEVRF